MEKSLSYMDLLIRFYDHHITFGEILTTFAMVVLFLYYLYNRNLRYWTFNLDEWGSYAVERGVRCNRAVKSDQLVECLPNKLRKGESVKTVYECFMHGLAMSKDGECLGRLVDNNTRYEYLRYSEVQKKAEIIGRLLKVRGLKRQSCIGIYASNCCEWVITQLGCVFQSIITVPLYDTLGLDSIRHTIKETEMAVMFSDSEDKLKHVLADRKQFPDLKIFILLHDLMKDPKFAEDCKAQDVELLTWSQASSIGAQHPEIKHDPPSREDIFVIQYTSGTTGVSKGVILQHKNTVACCAGADQYERIVAPKIRQNDPRIPLSPYDIMFLYLPMAHIYGQNSTVWFLYSGGKTAFSSGNIQRLMDEAQICKPTYFPLVPRVMNRLYTKIVEQTQIGFKGWLFWKCYERKRALLRMGCCCGSTIYDWIVFRKIQKMLGGNVVVMSTGSAPVAPEVLEFWRIVFGAFVIEAYGQTESAAMATWQGDIRGGNVGHPTMSCLVRLLDIPELGYTNDHNPPQGEICFKGANITQGYFKRPEQTKESFTPDGWFMTGDIGEYLSDGSLRIIDRRKNIFKLAQGEYIAPEKVESVYAQCPLVVQVFVDGNSLQTYTIAVVVPDEFEAKKWAAANGLPKNATLAEVCNDRKFQFHVLDALVSLGKQNRLNSLEQIKSLILQSQPFTVENGLLTPTMKNKRNELRKHFIAEMDALYNAGPMTEAVRQ